MLANVNRELAADLGFDVGAVAMQLRGMVEGVVPTKLREGDKEYDIRVRLAPEFRNDFETIGRTPLYSPTGAVVRARDIVRMEPAVGPANIDREARRRQAKIGVELADRALGDVTNDVASGHGRRQDAAELRMGICRRRRDDAGVGGRDGAGPVCWPSHSSTSCWRRSSSRFSSLS